ncbi:uncharacterized protein TNCT_473971 [Trichonephila clavata]|uniref:PKD/REJ-like domain-containing protein n=1 Tax=Trichonephila clavata TaxID=2740835 RepID=A0A8X6H880_TRICU|nr:uncharacterized protein TNCT_473971 [Trichonephila clavata]
MPCYSPILPLFLIGILYVATSVSYSDCHYALNITNDGPATLDVPVTVSAQLECADDKAEYLYEFEDNIHKTYRVLDHAEASASFIYTDHPAVRTVQVTAYLFSHPLFLVATGKTSFRIEDYIPGTLNFTGIVQDRNERKFLQTGSVTNISVQIHYPRLVLQESEFAYSWTIEEDHFTTDQSYKLHTFTEAGPHLIRVAVVGRVPFYPDKNGYRYKWGYFGDEITIKDPIVHINISGNTYLEHGQLLDLDISCNGSGPVDYCWKILPPSKNSSNFSCTDVVTSTECSFPILYYFRDSGDYQLAIHVNNLITSLEREIEVHIYDGKFKFNFY